MLAMQLRMNRKLICFWNGCVLFLGRAWYIMNMASSM